MKRKYIAAAATFAIAGMFYILLHSKKTIPKGVRAVLNFNKEKYLGKWYEIARFDYRFEKNLEQVTAEYTLNNDGTIKVTNRGYNAKTNKAKKSVGKARFVGNANEGKLKVSFFGPFYAGYNVIAIDEAYTNALVAGDSHDYLWLLSREKTMPENIKNEYLDIAKAAGFETENLVWTKQ